MRSLTNFTNNLVLRSRHWFSSTLMKVVFSGTAALPPGRADRASRPGRSPRGPRAVPSERTSRRQLSGRAFPHCPRPRRRVEARGGLRTNLVVPLPTLPGVRPRGCCRSPSTAPRSEEQCASCSAEDTGRRKDLTSDSSLATLHLSHTLPTKVHGPRIQDQTAKEKDMVVA